MIYAWGFLLIGATISVLGFEVMRLPLPFLLAVTFL